MNCTPSDPPAQDCGADESVVWHQSFGFGLFDRRAQAAAATVTVDFGPHVGLQALSRERAAMASPPPAGNEPVTLAIGVCAYFDVEPDPSRVGAQSPVCAEDDFVAALDSWEKTIDWIGRGWDCIEAYMFDLSKRASLAESMGALAAGRGSLRPEWVRQVHAADRRFMQATVASDLCVYNSGPPYQDFGQRVGFLLHWYDTDVFWYLYRWQPDTSIRISAGALDYWRDAYGLDFRSMTEEELVAQVHQLSAEALRWLAARRGSAPQGGRDSGAAELPGGDPEAGSQGGAQAMNETLRNLTVGQAVFHWKFGRGRVTSADWSEGKETARIDFGSNGVRVLAVDIARLVDPDQQAASSVGAAWKDLVDESRILVPLGREPWTAWLGPAVAGDDVALKAALRAASESVDRYPVGAMGAPDPGWPDVTALSSPATARRKGMVLGVVVVLSAEQGARPLAMMPLWNDWNVAHVVTPRSVRVCAGRIEAMVEADLHLGEDVLPIAFGLPTFHLGRVFLQRGVEVEVALTALAFECGPAASEPFSVRHPSDLVEALHRAALDLDLDADGAATYHVEGMSVWLPEADRADLANFRGQVLAVERIALPPEERAAWRLRVRAWRATANEWQLDVVFEASVWAGEEPPAVGIDIDGCAWLVGECLGPVVRRVARV